MMKMPLVALGHAQFYHRGVEESPVKRLSILTCHGFPSTHRPLPVEELSPLLGV